jgi:hypothetical protein
MRERPGQESFALSSRKGSTNSKERITAPKTRRDPLALNSDEPPDSIKNALREDEKKALELIRKARIVSPVQPLERFVTGLDVPRWMQDLTIAGDRKKEPEERLAAFERFDELFSKMPAIVAEPLFRWLGGQGSRSEVIKALENPVQVVKFNPRTGKFLKDNRGRKIDRATEKRILTAARRRNQGISQYEMATELFPKLGQDKAYQRTRDLFSKNRYAIDRAGYVLYARTKSR